MDNEKKYQAECERCEGTGKEHNNIARTIDECPYCYGRGYITTPAPLSEQKQQGETGLSIAVDILLEKGCLKSDERAKTIYHLGAAFGSKWQSQQTAKQIEEAAYQIDCLEHDKGELIKELDRTNADMIYCENACNAAKEDLEEANKQIDQYKARIVALESEILTLKNNPQPK